MMTTCKCLDTSTRTNRAHQGAGGSHSTAQGVHPFGQGWSGRGHHVPACVTCATEKTIDGMEFGVGLGLGWALYLPGHSVKTIKNQVFAL